MFNTNAQCYQNISQVLLTSAFILWPTCTRGFGIRVKIRCGLRFFSVFLCGFAVFRPPLRPPLVLKAFSVSPMYVSEVLLSLRLTVAWSITDVRRQFPVRGHDFFCRQLHELLSTELSVDLSVCLDAFRIRLLWLSIICLVLFMQL